MVHSSKENLINPDWSDLPIEILELFCNALTLPEQVRFGSVCKSWFSSAFKRTNPQVRDAPWLISPIYDGKREYLLLSLSHNQYYHMPKLSPDSYIVGSFKGWLVIQSEAKAQIRNPFSKVQYELPPQCTMPGFMSSKGPNIISMEMPVAFAISTCVHTNPNIIAVVTFGGNLALCKIGDTGWRGHRSSEAYSNLTFYKSKLYAINKQWRKIDIFKMDNDLKLSLVGSIGSLPRTTLFPNRVYLVESQGNLFLVKRYYDRSDSLAPITGFDVLKVDDECNPPRVAMVDRMTLNDQVLLLGDTSSESFAPKDCHGFEGNNIYFTGMSSYSFSTDFGIYSIKDTTLHTMQLPTNFFGLNWILPRFAVECNCPSK